MEIKDLKIRHCYSCGDDAVYKILDIGYDWIAYLSYSFNHNVASVHINKLDGFIKKGMQEVVWPEASVFEELRFSDYDYLKINIE